MAALPLPRTGMRVLSIQEDPFHVIPYENAASGGRIVPETLPMLRGVIDELPGGLEAIIAAADLQGRAPRKQAGSEPLLLGDLLARELDVLSERALLPPLDDVGVILAGDLSVIRTGPERWWR